MKRLRATARAIVRYFSRLSGSRARFYEQRLARCQTPRARALLQTLFDEERQAVSVVRLVTLLVLLTIGAVVFLTCWNP